MFRRSRPHSSAMGNRFSRTIATAVRSAMGQVWMGPSGVERQFLANGIGDQIEQRHRQSAPFDDKRRIDRKQWKLTKPVRFHPAGTHDLLYLICRKDFAAADRWLEARMSASIRRARKVATSYRSISESSSEFEIASP